jgi:hypothetical protein
VKLFVGVITGREALIPRVRDELEGAFGAIDLESDLFPFGYTDYYRQEMGEGLLRGFVSFGELIDPARLREIKLRTMAIERAFSERSERETRRTVNLDPGYVAPSKVVLATTKDFAHRISLGEGIYAEVTLNFARTGCVFHEWTYPDFKSEAYTPFLLELRRRVMEQSGRRRG